MNRVLWIAFFVVAISLNSVQQPTFFKNSFKGLTGAGVGSLTRVRDRDDIRVVYYHDQTVAVVDVGGNNELHNCNLIEVYEPAEANEFLKNLSMATHPQLVTFPEMTKLMDQCEQLDKFQEEHLPLEPAGAFNRGTETTGSSFTLLQGILPGTKWCGTGDIAENYHDLGHEAKIDRCCRSHDLCPVKVRAQQTRYNLTNYSIYTKSHCSCDEALYKCLKAARHPTANVMGHIYFNLVKVQCIEDLPNQSNSRNIARRLIPAKMSY